MMPTEHRTFNNVDRRNKMSNLDIARALKDKDYFNSLTEAQKSQVKSAQPAGEAELTDGSLEEVSGGLTNADQLPDTVSTGTGSVHPPCQCSC
jgi:mersacidin/lichenicidin family type 2 lantibiotic